MVVDGITVKEASEKGFPIRERKFREIDWREGRMRLQGRGERAVWWRRRRLVKYIYITKK